VPLAHQPLLDLIEAGVRARVEREREMEATREDHNLRAILTPRYAAVMAELERKAERSRVTYESTFRHFVEDCETIGACWMPATPCVVGQYLENLRDCGATAAHLRREKAAISFMHSQFMEADPTHDPLIAAIIHDTYQDEKKPRRANGKH
jgi:hypothetical protein